jgi:hypothetical protein
MTAVKDYKNHTSAKRMMNHREAWLQEDNQAFITFKIYSRDGKKGYLVVIRKNDLFTTCNCEYATNWGRNDPNGCWHMRKAMHSYLLRIQREEVM